MKSSSAYTGKPISFIVGQQLNKLLCNRSTKFFFQSSLRITSNDPLILSLGSLVHPTPVANSQVSVS